MKNLFLAANWNFEDIDRSVSIFMFIIILLALFLVIRSYRTTLKEFRIFTAIVCAIFLVLVYFALQSETEAYISGTILLFISVIGIILPFIPSAKNNNSNDERDK